MMRFGLSTLLAMFDAQVTGIVQRGVDARRFAWSARFQDETTRVESDFAVRGAGHSGALLKAVSDVCVKEIETRASDIWEDLYRALVATGVRPSPDLPTELKRFFNELFRVYTDEPQRRFEGTCDRMGGVSPALRTATGFDGRVYGVRARIESQIDLFSRSLERRSPMNQSGGDTIFQIYAPVGVIQTGADAKANLVQNFDAVRKEFTDLLRQVESQLAQAATLTATQTAELRDAIDETHKEIEKPHPGGPMLFAKLQVVAQLISTAKEVAPVFSEALFSEPMMCAWRAGRNASFERRDSSADRIDVSARLGQFVWPSQILTLMPSPDSLETGTGSSNSLPPTSPYLRCLSAQYFEIAPSGSQVR